MATDKENTPQRRIEDKHPAEKIDWSQPEAPAVPLSVTAGAAKGGTTSNIESPDLATTAAQPLDLDKLEALAKAATPGPWELQVVEEGLVRHLCPADTDGVSILTVVEQDGTPFGAVYDNSDAEFIAAANPATILTLIAQARAALAPVAAQQAAAEKHNAVECDSALRTEPAGIIGASVAAEDQAFYKFWYSHMQGDVMSGALADVSHSTARYVWDAASRCRAEGGNTSDNEVSQAAAKAPAAQADEILSLHRQLAAEKLRADQGWERAESKSRECIELRAILAASPASTPDASQQAAAVAAPNLTHVGTLTVYEDKEATFGHAYDISTNMAGHQALQSMDGYKLYAAPATAVAATTSEDARDAALEDAAKICDQQALEPECPERAEYCAEAIRALKSNSAMRATQQEGGK